MESKEHIRNNSHDAVEVLMTPLELGDSHQDLFLIISPFHAFYNYISLIELIYKNT